MQELSVWLMCWRGSEGGRRVDGYVRQSAGLRWQYELELGDIILGERRDVIGIVSMNESSMVCVAAYDGSKACTRR